MRGKPQWAVRAALLAAVLACISTLPARGLPGSEQDAAWAAESLANAVAAVALSGRIVDSDGAGVVGAVVKAVAFGDGWAGSWEPVTTRTDYAGHFRLTGLPAAGGSLEVVADGYERYRQWVQPPRGFDGELKLQPIDIGRKLGTIRLEFVDEAGDRIGPTRQPGETQHDWLSRASVWAPRIEFGPRGRSYVSSHTSELHIAWDGTVETHSPPGVWRLFLTLPGHRLLDGSRLRSVDLSAGRGLAWWDEVVVTSERVTSVRYVVEPIPRAQVLVHVDKRLSDGTVVSVSDGYVMLGESMVTVASRVREDRPGPAVVFDDVPVGEHRLDIGGVSGYAPAWTQVEIVGAEWTHSVILEADAGEPGESLRGEVRVAEFGRQRRRSVDGAVSGMVRGRRYGVSAETRFPPYARVEAAVAQDGQFVLPDLHEGLWDVELRSGAGGSGGCGASTWTELQVDASDTGDIEFQVRETYSFAGHFEGEFAQIRIVEIWDLASEDCLATASVAADGSFGPMPVPAGTHELRGLSGPSWGWPLHSELMSFPPNEAVVVQVDPAVLHVRVIDAKTSDPLPEAYVDLRPPVNVGYFGNARTIVSVDQNGEFLTQPLAFGTWMLSVNGQRVAVELAPGDQAALTVELAPELPLPPRVRYAAGSHPATRLQFTAADGANHYAYLDPDGSIHGRVIAGEFDLTVTTESGYEYRTRLQLPGPEVVLPQHPVQGRLRVLIPELYAYDGDIRVALTSVAGGRQARDVRDDDSREAPERWEILAPGVIAFEPVPPGEYEIRVAGEDGREFRGTGKIIAFTENDIVARSTGSFP